LFAQLTANSVILTNANGDVLNPVPMGAFVYVQVSFNITGLAANASYKIRTTVNGENLDGPSLNWGAGTAGTSVGTYRHGIHYVNTTASSVSISATLDIENTVAETNESDNVRSASIGTSSFAPKFSAPIGGTQGVDWTIVNYCDVDRNTTGVKDYLGGPWAYDGHDALDITLANFRKADQGVPVYAAAPGTVIEVHDGDWDRNTPDYAAPGANYVIVDHGGGWIAYYWHMRLNSVAVSVGQPVTRGQVLGMVGSSGSSSDAHLHFSTYYKNSLVETYTAPSSYWQTPYAYSGTLRTALDADMIDASASVTGPEFRERPPVQRVFARGERARTWVHLSGLQVGETMRFRYIGPDNNVYMDVSFGTSGTNRYDWYTGSSIIPANAPLGQWHALVDMAGVTKWDIPFTVTQSGAANLELMQGTTYIIDGRRTPIDFGTINQSSTTGGSLPFTIKNRGVAPLSVTNLQLPDGFLLDGSLPSSIPANSSAIINIKLDQRFGSVRQGNIILTTGDPDQPTTTFAVKGAVIDDRAPSFVSGLFDFDANVMRVQFDEFIDQGYFYHPDVTVRRLSDNLNILVEPAYPGADRSNQQFNFYANPEGLPDGNYRLTLPAATIGDLSSHFAATGATVDFFVLAADANRDRKVDTQDFNILAANFGGSNKVFSQGNFNYDALGTVDSADFNLFIAQYGKQLAAPMLVPAGMLFGERLAEAEDLESIV
jgi:murein DD-endopeptidase MepM/ murein hydrolase activator NlpD